MSEAKKNIELIECPVVLNYNFSAGAATTRFLRGSVCKNQDRIAMVQQYLDDLGDLIVQVEPRLFENRQQLVSKDPDWSKLLSATQETLPSLEKNLREKSLKEIKVHLRG